MRSGRGPMNEHPVTLVREPPCQRITALAVSRRVTVHRVHNAPFTLDRSLMRILSWAWLATLAMAIPLASAAAIGPADHPHWATPVPAQVQVPAYVTKAMDDPARAFQKEDDVRRQMAAVMAFTGVKPGDTVLELAPGTGYWTRVFSQIVGPKGHVYQEWPEEWGKYDQKAFDAWVKLAATPHYANVTPLRQRLWDITVPQKVDIVFTSENYHDFHDPFSGHVDIPAFNKHIFDDLKPSGVFIVIDNKAPPGAGDRDTNTLHRIGENVAKREIEAAGFVLDGSSDALINPLDPLTVRVFDPSIKGHVSQFMLRFRKPAK